MFHQTHITILYHFLYCAAVNSIKIILPSMSASKISTALKVSNGNLQEAVELLLSGEDG